MDRELTRAELDELLPLFALDALEGEEREQVARYVSRDAFARAEVESLRDAATYLPHPPVSAPADLWQGIEHELRSPGAPEAPSTPPAPAPPGDLPAIAFLDARRPAPRRSPSRRARWLGVAAAVVLLLAITVSAVLAVRVAHQQDRIDALASEMHHDTMAKQAEMALTVPGAHSAMLTSATGSSAQVVMLPDGAGYFMHSDLAALPQGRTYQLWARVEDASGTSRYVSVGVLGRNPSVVPFRSDDAVTGFLVTEEDAGGDASPTTPMIEGVIS